MRGRCFKCGDDQELVRDSPRQVLHALTQLASPLEIEVPIRCTNCGREVGANVQFVATNKNVHQPSRMDEQPAVERRHGTVWGGTVSLNYPGVLIPGQNVLYPTHEGRLSSGHSIDRYGDPDLMAEFSIEYLKQYRTIVPKGRLPHTVSEMMPALNLLVNAAELAMKADLIRSGNDSGGHSLPTLYRRVDCKHREEIERRFNEAPPNGNLRTLGSDPPTVESVLSTYEHGFGWSSVYQDTRYYAEPTTKVKSKDAKGGNLVKGTPYPIFLPVVVQTIIDVYGFFAGAERLKRLGAEVGFGSRDPGNDQHGDWGLVPSSVGLVVFRVAQFVAQTKRGELREEFRQFKETRPPLYCTSWMYGGNVLLFYRAGRERHEDGKTVIDSLRCEVWYTGSLGMHPRDLFLLADALEAPGEVEEFQWASSSAR